jgi:RNA polymerase sigma-70 factor (ECF subfamily)
MPTLALIRMSTEALTDEGLLDACRAGDESAFVALVRRHHPALVALARCWPGDAHEAQRDVASAWMALLELVGRQSDGPSRGLCVRALAGREVTRAATRRTNVALQVADVPLVDPDRFFARDHELWAEAWADPPRPWGRMAARRLDQADVPRLLVRRTRELGVAQAAALTLRDIHGWPLVECAAALELSQPQARSLVRAAREGLRAALEAEIDSR